MENDEKILSLQDCSRPFFYNRYSVLSTTGEEETRAKNIIRWLEELEAELTDNQIFSNVESSFAEICESLSPTELCVGEYNMSSMLDVLKTEIDVLRKDYDDTIEELKKIAASYESASRDSYNEYKKYQRQEIRSASNLVYF